MIVRYITACTTNCYIKHDTADKHKKKHQTNLDEESFGYGDIPDRIKCAYNSVSFLAQVMEIFM